MAWQYNDGGRAAAGFEGKTGDCVTRAVAIATGKPYAEVYAELFNENKNHAATRRDHAAKKITEKGASPRKGIYKGVSRKYLASLGWKWIPTMGIGTGCKVHLKAEELPKGTIICKVSKHLVAVIDGVIQDTHDCSREGTRCVYGYYTNEG